MILIVEYFDVMWPQSIQKRLHAYSCSAVTTYFPSEYCFPHFREFIEKHYVDLKLQNPKFPFLIRECSGIEPKIFGRYGMFPQSTHVHVLRYIFSEYSGNYHNVYCYSVYSFFCNHVQRVGSWDQPFCPL